MKKNPLRYVTKKLVEDNVDTKIRLAKENLIGKKSVPAKSN